MSLRRDGLASADPAHESVVSAVGDRQAYALDPLSAAAEYDSEFRDDVAALFDAQMLSGVTSMGALCSSAHRIANTLRFR